MTLIQMLGAFSLSYNPVNRLLRNTKDSSRVKGDLHPSLSVLEVVAFLSFLPGMFVFLPAFMFSALAMFACFEVGKGNNWLAGCIFFFVNLIPGVIGLLLALTESSNFGKYFLFAVLYGGIGIWGLLSIYLQSRQFRGSS